MCPGVRQGVSAAEMEKHHTPSHVMTPHRPRVGRRKRAEPGQQGASCPPQQFSPPHVLGTPTQGPQEPSAALAQLGGSHRGLEVRVVAGRGQRSAHQPSLWSEIPAPKAFALRFCGVRTGHQNPVSLLWVYVKSHVSRVRLGVANEGSRSDMCPSRQS